MNHHERARAFAPIAERLGKIVPRLGSNHQGEVTATLDAIGRTLQGAGLDWHDLAERIARPTSAVAEMPAVWPQPAWNPAPQPTPSKPYAEPSPWPTFGTTSHARRKLWLKAIAKEAGLMSTVSAEVFKAFRDRMVDAPTTVTTDDTRLFNRLARAGWEQGIRIDRTPPPWPTWGTLSHFGRIRQLDAIKAAGCIPAEDAERFAAFHADYYRHQVPPGRKTINLFNAACRTLWEMGARSEEAA